MQDYGLSASDEDAIRLAPEPKDLLNAMDFPMAGWPCYQELYRRDPPVPVRTGPRKLLDWEERALGRPVIVWLAGIFFLGPRK